MNGETEDAPRWRSYQIGWETNVAVVVARTPRSLLMSATMTAANASKVQARRRAREATRRDNDARAARDKANIEDAAKHSTRSAGQLEVACLVEGVVDEYDGSSGPIDDRCGDGRAVAGSAVHPHFAGGYFACAAG